MIQNKIYKSITNEILEQVFSITKTNMEDLYNASNEWKWDDTKESIDSNIEQVKSRKGYEVEIIEIYYNI